METFFLFLAGLSKAAFILFSIGVVIYIVWTIFWKAWSLWIAARKGSKIWFIALMLLNTVGILEILYIFYFSKKEDKKF